MREKARPQRIARRALLKQAGAAAAAAGLLGGVRIRRRARLAGRAEAAEPPPAARGYRPPVMQTVTLTVNGAEYTVEVDTRDTLANLLRERLRLTGTHVTCDRGECGGCGENRVRLAALTALAEGRPALEEIDLLDDPSLPDGAVCGGVMEVLIEPFGR